MSEIRFATHPEDVRSYDTRTLRERFVMEQVMVPGEVTSFYSMHDRMVTMGVVPVDRELSLPPLSELTKAEFFLERRELGIINTGGVGTVSVDGDHFVLANKECLYIGRGKKDVRFQSDSAKSPAAFYINSCPAHAEYPVVKSDLASSNQVNLGTKENCNERVIYQYIHEQGIQSCQLVMGFTQLKTGSIWNTFPPHTHYRRMEVYFYFDLPENQLVMHFMGEPNETRHLALRNQQAVISPEWSIHAGAGTSAYSFIWGMAGENKAFTDMDGVNLNEVR